MGKKGLHIAWIFFFLFAGASTFGQDSAAVSARVDRTTIQIGQPIQFLLDATVPAGSSVQWFVIDSISHFDFVEKGKLDSTDSSGWTILRQRLTITSFDSGSRWIPSFHLLVGNKQYSTDSIRIEVSYSPFDPKQDYHDIKDIIDVENPYVKYIAVVISVITLLCLLLVFLFIRKAKKRTQHSEKQVFSSLSPFDEAVKALDNLKKQHLPENGQVKLYYTRLNDILRLFILRKLNISSMEKTNDELILQLRSLALSPAQLSKLTQALRMSDYVKFAKYLPTQDDNDYNFGVIESSVQLLNEMNS